MNKRKILLLAVFAVLSSYGSSVAEAAAASQPVGSNCVYILQPIGPGSEPGSVAAAPVPGGCFATFSAAVSAGTGGAVTLPSSATPLNLTQDMLDANASVSVAAADYLLGTEFYGTGYGGTSRSYFGSTGCGSNTWDLAYVGDGDNDKFSSGKGFSSCDHNKKFEHKNFGGAVLTCTPNCSNYGALSREVSSLRWKD